MPEEEEEEEEGQIDNRSYLAVCSSPSVGHETFKVALINVFALIRHKETDSWPP